MEYSNIEQVSSLIQSRGQFLVPKRNKGTKPSSSTVDATAVQPQAVFDQTTREMGNIWQDDDEIDGAQDRFGFGNAPQGSSGYTLQQRGLAEGEGASASNIYFQKPTYKESTQIDTNTQGKGQGEASKQTRPTDEDDQEDSSDSGDDEDLEALEQQELDQEYDQIGDNALENSFGSDCDLMDPAQELSDIAFEANRKARPSVQIKRKKSNSESLDSPSKKSKDKKKKTTTKTLTFVDMSNLSYLSRSNLADASKPKPIYIPKDTACPILEEEEDSNDDDDDSEIQTKIDSSETIAKNIISELINVVFDSQTVDVEEDTIEDNDKILDNLNSIHKQVFVKVTNNFLKDDPLIRPKNPQSLPVGTGFGGFKKKVSIPMQKSQQSTFKKTVRPTVDRSFFKKQPAQAASSGFSDIMDSQKEQGFMLKAPKPTDRDYVQCKVYFFKSPNKLTIQVSSKELVSNVVKHLLTMYEHSPMATKLPPLAFPGDETAYELRLVDDYESEFCPDMDMPSLTAEDEFGQLDHLAFIQKKSKKMTIVPQSNKSSTEDAIMKQVKEDQMAVQILPQIRLIKSNEANWFILEKESRVGIIYEMIAKKRGLRVLNPDKYVLLAVEDQAKRDRKTEEMSDLFGGYNPFGQDDKLIDPQTLVKNLKFNKLELREKIYCDKKQAEIDGSLEQRKDSVVPEERKMSTVNGSDQKIGDATKQQQYRTADDFLFGQISASQLQEFKVIKFNKKNKPQDRILCIDAFNLYNKKPGQTNTEGGSKSFFGSIVKKLGGNKRKMYSVKSVLDVQRAGPNDFQIILKPEPKLDEKKYLRYKAQPDDCSQIIAKLNFLQTHNKQNQLQHH